MKESTTSRCILQVVLILALLSIARTACAQGSEKDSRSTTQAKLNAPPVGTHDEPTKETTSYVIGPGDLLAIHVWHEADISGKVPVRTDGKISIPLVGQIQASGLTTETLQAQIAWKLREYIKNPEVTVVVEEMNSRQFNVMGEVQHPGSFPLIRPTRVIDALAQAGGFRDFARTTKIYILRQSPQGATVTFPFNYKSVSKGKDVEQNIELRPGDTVVVP